MKQVVLLTNAMTLEKILIGTESIISAKEHMVTRSDGEKIFCTKIESRGAMVSTSYVTETPQEIYNQINQS